MHTRTYNGMEFRGLKATSQSCPIAAWLHEGGFGNPVVDEFTICVYDYEGREMVEIRTPPAAAAFIRWFDDAPDGTDPVYDG